jgi:hypothetical protein
MDREDSAPPEREAGTEIQRDRRDTQSPRNAGEDGEADDDPTQLEQNGRSLQRLPAVEELDDLFDPSRGPNNDEVVTRFDPEIRLRGRDGFVASQYRDD